MGSRAKAVEPLPLPLPEFQLTKLDGTTLSTKELAQQEQWVLIYTMPDCPACETLLRLVDKTEHPELPAKVIVVVSGASAEKVKSLAGKFPDLEETSWYADPEKEGVKQLKLQGLPAVFGVHQDTLEWCVMGVLSADTLNMESLLSSWCEK